MKRLDYHQHLNESFEVTPVCAILGPRQCGKTTFAKQYSKNFQGKVHIFDLEDPLDLTRLENPMLALRDLEGLIIIDEIQRAPELFPSLRVLVDEGDHKRFLILGSASQDLIRQSSETLAGRISYIEMTPFSLRETENMKALWLRGGFPRSYLARTEKISVAWRKSYIRTFLERDIREFGFNISSQMMRRFWLMLSHYHGNIFNASELGRSLSVSHSTTAHYLDILTGTFMVRRLNPWFENLSKRQVKSPKVYFRDSGLLHALMGIENQRQLEAHPQLGASWEGFALEEVVRSLKVDTEDCYFWGTQAGAELDLVVLKEGGMLGFEFKYTDRPRMTKSLHIALNDLPLEKITLIIPGVKRFPLTEKVEVCGIELFSQPQEEIQ